MPSRRSAALLALLLAGCPAPKEPAPSPDAAARPARAGVKVPLPDGWTARVGNDQSFQAGPQDRVVLRIDQRSGAAAELPSPAELQEGLRAGVPDAQVELVAAEVEEEHVVLRLRLRRALDGGVKTLPLAIGAKRMGADLYLCATEPGATESEVEKAAAACAGLALAPGP